MKERVLITGISGFTGHYIKDKLVRSGYQVFGTTYHDQIAQDKTRPLKVSDDLFHCDLQKPDQIKQVFSEVKPNYVLHLAALSFVGHTPIEDFYNVNVVGTTHLLDVASQQQGIIKKVVLASTANVYGIPNSECVTENSWPAPINHYAASKLAMEHMARTYSNRFPIIITRPFNYTGPGQHEKFLVPKIVKHFKEKQKTISLGNIDVSRDISDVEDVAEVYFRLIDKELPSCTVNICSGQAISLLEIIEHLNKVVGYKIEVQVNPEFVRKNEIPRLVGSQDYLKELIGPIQFRPLTETIQRMLYA